MTTTLGPEELRSQLGAPGELALIDVREALIFSEGHLLLARSVPLSRFELTFAALVPRRATPVVLCDDGGGLAERAAAILARSGYSDVGILAGGIAAWQAAGYELFTGVNVPSKAFGEYVEHAGGTPSIAADELESLLRRTADIVVLDSRPFDEYARVSIPTAINVPGAELVLRARDIAPSPETTIVVNCAGRTRSIIGAQSLINAGIPNRVVALRNGTMGWSLAGFRCDSGKNRRASDVSPTALAWAGGAAARAAQRCGVESIDRATLDCWRRDAARTLYVFDVRDPAEYAAGHVAGAISAPGGQLVQATDEYIGTLGARIVLVDDKTVRAAMTGSWLRQMGFADVLVLSETGSETERPEPPALAADTREGAAIDCAELANLMSLNAATVVDLSRSDHYRVGHIPGAWFAIRTRLARAFAKMPLCETVVLTSEDGALARLAVKEAEEALGRPVRYLNGGNDAWRAGGRPASTDALFVDDEIDRWRKPYERTGDVKAAMAEYLAWETDLLPRIARDGTLKFFCMQR